MRRSFTDQLGRIVEVDYPSKRIVSLVPSQTELLFDLGLDEEVVGITKFCIHPDDKWRTRPRVGGTKNFHIDKIASLRPDLIIGNKEENSRDLMETLMERYPVWISDVVTLEDALDMILKVGALVDRSDQARALSDDIAAAFQRLEEQKRQRRDKRKAAYLIWRKPWMAVANDTFIHSMIERAGFQNVLSDKTRYPEITLEELSAANPDVIMLSSEPYPFKEKHIEEIRQICQESVVTLVDGELFSWYGSRLLQSVKYFENFK